MTSGKARKSDTGALQGKTVLVTGASDGIGREAVLAYVKQGASVTMIGRNAAKTAAAANRIMSETGRRVVSWDTADLSDRTALRELASRLRERLDRIDVLVNNAGALFLERKLTAEGIEQTFALNHLGYFELTLLLLDRVGAAARAGDPGRILVVSSRAHRNARLSFDDLDLARRFRGWRAYANSKLCNVLFARALAARLDPSRVVVHALHPGVVSTRFATNNGGAGRLLRRAMDIVSVTPAQGADTMVWLASADEARVSTGDYWVRRERVQPSRAARDDAAAERLWQESARLTGLEADAIVAEALAGAPAHLPWPSPTA